ncbi:Coiled-coil and C2 domain-containing protein 2A, partial [Stegodyphus mimosarum]
MQKVREEVAERFYISQHQKVLEDVVVEEKVPSIGMIGFSLLKLLQTKRPLYPARKERKKVICATGNMNVKIIIKILHATNVPVRMDVSPFELAESSSEETAIHIESQVQPFVEVMFQRVAVKTGIADGPHPTWNQELVLPFQAPNADYSPTSLESVKDIIYINLFDEVAVDLLEDDKERSTVVYERLERRWLGNLKIPFTTLYLNSKIEGMFRINVPPVLLSYQNEPRPWLSGMPGVSSNQTYLSFFMTIEPCLQLPDVFRDQYDSGEPEKVLAEVEKWRQTIIPRFPDRMIKLMSVDLSGKWIFITRFLRPLAPPKELVAGNKESIETMELLARFVSLIPTVSDSIAFPGLCDIWSTSDQFLQMLTGDEEEHAILLCNYFLHLGKKAMLLLGSGVPEGPTAYVATWEKSKDVLVWNASTGDHFSVRDNYCPLQSVGCLISPDNVWANIQKNNHPSRINFDLNKSGEWKPFFSRSFPNLGLRSIQPTALNYNSTDPDYVKNLEESIRNNLEESIIKWRYKTATSWNSNCNKVLYKILNRLERNAGRTASDDSLQELEQILRTHKVNGFPLTMPYTDNDAVVESVFATGVHQTEDKNAEFSLAVYIHAYPCSVLAVWVYVATLIRR